MTGGAQACETLAPKTGSGSRLSRKNAHWGAAAGWLWTTELQEERSCQVPHGKRRCTIGYTPKRGHCGNRLEAAAQPAEHHVAKVRRVSP